jgi:hypothetical protein
MPSQLTLIDPTDRSKSARAFSTNCALPLRTVATCPTLPIHSTSHTEPTPFDEPSREPSAPSRATYRTVSLRAYSTIQAAICPPWPLRRSSPLPLLATSHADTCHRLATHLYAPARPAPSRQATPTPLAPVRQAEPLLNLNFPLRHTQPQRAHPNPCDKPELTARCLSLCDSSHHTPSRRDKPRRTPSGRHAQSSRFCATIRSRPSPASTLRQTRSYPTIPARQAMPSPSRSPATCPASPILSRSTLRAATDRSPPARHSDPRHA